MKEFAKLSYGKLCQKSQFVELRMPEKNQFMDSNWNLLLTALVDLRPDQSKSIFKRKNQLNLGNCFFL